MLREYTRSPAIFPFVWFPVLTFSSYDGDLLITLDTGLKITLSNDLLVVPHTYIDQETGDIVAEDTTEPDLLIDCLQGVRETDMAAFGSLFFSAAYLSVNLDAGKFTLWAANSTTNSKQDFRALDTKNDESTTLCQAGETDVQSNSTGSEPTTSGIASGTTAPDEEQDKLSTGATAGIAVGVIIAAIGAIGGFLLYWMRRRKRRAEYMAAEMADTSGSSSQKELPAGNDRHQSTRNDPFELQDDHSGGYHRRELHEDWVQKYEMPDSGPPIRHELSG